MRLISWTLRSGSEQYILVFFTYNRGSALVGKSGKLESLKEYLYV
jgi:hypothetical protein